MSIVRDMMDFIDESPVSFYAVENISRMLEEAGFTELFEGENWELRSGGYYVKRNDSSIIAFRIPHGEPEGIMMVSAHSDSPCFKVKENPETKTLDMMRLMVEGYGGMLMSTWIDRPLSVAGRAFIKTQDGIKQELVNIDRDILMMPGLAIHMDRKANDGHEYKKNVDVIPLFSDTYEAGALNALIAQSLGVSSESIISSDLYVYNREHCRTWGLHEEFVSGPRLDDLMCAYAGARAICDAPETECIQILNIFDNEEVGSLSYQGASSTFLTDTLKRIVRDDEKRQRLMADSFNVSADNAHAAHPNFPELSDANNRARLNGGVVIKKNASQKYATDGYARALFMEACENAGVKYQNFENRPDLPGGSTLGNLLNINVSVPTVDIGIAQLSMHSAYETAGALDEEKLVEALKSVYKMHIKNEKNGIKVHF